MAKNSPFDSPFSETCHFKNKPTEPISFNAVQYDSSKVLSSTTVLPMGVQIKCNGVVDKHGEHAPCKWSGMLHVHTQEGPVTLEHGDWVVQRPNSTFDVLKDSIVRAKYVRG